MDPVSHTAIGLTLAQAGAKRWTPNWAWVMVLAGGAPDVDTLVFLPGDVNILNWHRHFTHSLAFAPVLALAVVLFVRYVLRRQLHFKGAFGVALLGVVAHDLTDLLTYRGTRVLLPFDDHFHALGLEAFLDPVMYLLLGLGVAIPFLSNLVSGEIGARRGSGMVTAWVILFLLMGWWGVRHLLREQALAELDSRIFEGAAPQRIDVVASWHPLRFRGLVEGEKFHKLIDIDLLDYFDLEGGQTLYRQPLSVEAGQALRVASASRSGQIFLAWARWPRSQVTRLDGKTRWVVVWEELAALESSTRARVIIRLGEDYAIESEVYERAKSTTGL